MTNLKANTIQVFEHQTIRVGEELNGIRFNEHTFQALAIYQEKQAQKYFQLVYKGVKFSHYVGIIKVGRLTIEILPKADKPQNSDTKKWQNTLVELLSYCRLLKIETPGLGNVQLKSNTILDLFLERFLTQIHQLIIKGLPKRYLKKEGNLKALKGKLHLPKQLRKNIAHPERFYVQYHSFEYQHLFNQILWAALKILQKIPLRATLKRKLYQAINLFPKLPNRIIKPSDFDRLFSSKKYQPHQELLELSRLVLFNFNPDISGGKHHLFALLFDMNKLYEEYIFWQLKKWESLTVKIQRQTSKPFWQRRLIRPDILIQIEDKRYVLDTKWKVMTNNRPSMEDLKQLYIYCQYFNTTNGILMYPDVIGIPNTKAIPFQASKSLPQTIYAQLLFTKIMDNSGRLDKELGKKLIETLTNSSPFLVSS